MNQFIKEGITNTLAPKLTLEADQSQVQNQRAINKRGVLGWIDNEFLSLLSFPNLSDH